jgi:hypothetical protein
MKEIDGKKYAESLEEYFAQFDSPELKAKKEAEGQANQVGNDNLARYGLSDKEYEALSKPIRVY